MEERGGCSIGGSAPGRGSEIPLPPRDLHLPDGVGTRRLLAGRRRARFRRQAAVAPDQRGVLAASPGAVTTATATLPGTASDGEFDWGGTSSKAQRRCPKAGSARTETSRRAKGQMPARPGFSVRILAVKAWPIDPFDVGSFKREVSEKLPQG